MMRFLMHPAEEGQVVCAGKGGSHGDVFMMQHAIEMLKAQGHSGDKSKIMMVGDRFDTDIRGGISCGIKTCLVQSGAHRARMQKDFPLDVADFTAPSVAWLNPRSKRDLLAVPTGWGPAVDHVSFDRRLPRVVSRSSRAMTPDGTKLEEHQFVMASSSVSELSRNEATMKIQVQGAVDKLTMSLGAAPSFVIMTGLAKENRGVQLMKALIGPCRGSGTILHGCSTFHGAMTDDSLGDELGLLGIRDEAGKYSIGWAPGASLVSKAQDAGYSAAATALATAGAMMMRAPSVILLTATEGMEELVIAGIEQLLRDKGLPIVPIFGGSAASLASTATDAFVVGVNGHLGLSACFGAALPTTIGDPLDGAVIVSMLWPSVDVEVAFGSAFKAQAVGVKGVVTAAADGRVLMQVDDLPAMDWYTAQCQKQRGGSPDQVSSDDAIPGPMTPLVVGTDDDGGRCLAVKELREDGCLILHADIKTGDGVALQEDGAKQMVRFDTMSPRSCRMCLLQLCTCVVISCFVQRSHLPSLSSVSLSTCLFVRCQLVFQRSVWSRDEGLLRTKHYSWGCRSHF